MAERFLAALAVVPFLLGAASAPSAETTVVFSFADPAIDESSGLVLDGDLAYTINDSGDSGRVFAIDTSSGETVGITTYAAEATDVEALAPAGPGEAWVADIGDNTERRDSVQVTRVPVGRGDRDVDAPSYDLTYPDGPHDAESLLCDPTTGQLYVASKSVVGGTLYAAPAELGSGTNQLEPLGDVLPLATDAAFFPDGQHLVVRNYAAAAVYAFPSLERLDTFALPSQEQGEGIAVAPDGSLLLSSEGQGAEVLRVDLPSDLRDAVLGTASASPAASSSASSSASPSPTRPATESREDRELPESTDMERSAWPWFLSGILGVGFSVLLSLSLRRR